LSIARPCKLGTSSAATGVTLRRGALDINRMLTPLSMSCQVLCDAKPTTKKSGAGCFPAPPTPDVNSSRELNY
jgi:hypothetical protein